MRVLVAGGTGRLGSSLVARLLRRSLEVRVLARSPESAHLADEVEVVAGDVRVPHTLVPAVAGVDTIVSAVHGLVGSGGVSPQTVDRDGNRNLVDAAAEAGCDLVLMSLVGASPDHPMELARMKYAAEEYARASGVPTTIVRATAFTELWVDLLRQTAGRGGRPLVFGRGDNPINFVSVEDVAALVEIAVTKPEMRGSILEIGGPENITLDELARATATGPGGPVRPRHISPIALRVMAATLGNLRPQLGRQMRSSLLMDSMDLRFDGSAVHASYPDLPATTVREVLARQSGHLTHDG